MERGQGKEKYEEDEFRLFLIDHPTKSKMADGCAQPFPTGPLQQLIFANLGAVLESVGVIKMIFSFILL